MDNYGIAKDFNNSSNGLNGIIAKLAGYDVNNFSKKRNF